MIAKMSAIVHATIPIMMIGTAVLISALSQRCNLLLFYFLVFRVEKLLISSTREKS